MMIGIIDLDLITPNWPAPTNVRAISTTRQGGVSAPPFDGLNLGDHVGDFPANVEENRMRLASACQFNASMTWLEQVHGTDCATLPNAQRQIRADAVTSKVPLQVCTVMTADCLPVLFCDTKGEQVAAAHAGWRGLCDGVLENTVAQFTRPRTEIMAWLGPAISVRAFEVGDEVREQFLLQDPNAHLAFIRSDLSGTEKKWFADLYLLAKQRLQALGVTQIFGGEFCTYGDPSRFFSYRRDGQTGRQASCIWLTA